MPEVRPYRVQTLLFENKSSATGGGSASGRIQMFGEGGDQLGTKQNVSTYEFLDEVVDVVERQNWYVFEVEEGETPMVDVKLSPRGV